MKLWLLDRPNADAYPGMSEMAACLVRAESENEARRLANDNHMAEGYVWLDPALVTCEEVVVEGEPGLLMIEMNYS